jgi:hypothetical protein
LFVIALLADRAGPPQIWFVFVAASGVIGSILGTILAPRAKKKE